MSEINDQLVVCILVVVICLRTEYTYLVRQLSKSQYSAMCS